MHICILSGVVVMTGVVTITGAHMHCVRQHISFQPALVNLPSPLPTSLRTYWDTIEDDEMVWRMHKEYGDEALVKVRSVIGRFDVGKMEGGLQTGGMRAAKVRQLNDSNAARLADAEAWPWQRRTNQKGRLSGARVRLSVDHGLPHDVRIEGKPAGKVIEKRVLSQQCGSHSRS